MTKIPFTVDSALLRELGERLVGKPHIALAELVKNSYDADATEVVINFRNDQIEVSDNGLGMSFDEFSNRWMRVGTQNKNSEKLSRVFHRAMTGSKGVGRLSVQFLATRLEMRSVSANDLNIELRAEVDWLEAVQAGDLTNASVEYELLSPPTSFGEGESGTIIILSGLNQEWDGEAFSELAKQIWPLQPPLSFTTQGEISAVGGFSVKLVTDEDPDIEQSFQSTMEAVLDLWHARVRGRLIHDSDGPLIEVLLEFSDGTREKANFRPSYDYLDQAEIEIRIFELHRRQRFGIKVDEARLYIRQYGGIHIYDAGFHLPYYGQDTDWLGVERDHAHRLSRSLLLPEELQFPEGLNYLPTNARIWGVVKVDTGHERSSGRASSVSRLDIQVSRDRLLDNAAYQELKAISRWCLDYYAMNQARRVFSQDSRVRAIQTDSKASVEGILSEFSASIPEEVLTPLTRQITSIMEDVREESQNLANYAGLLGALATAGMAGLALEHEITKQFDLLERLVTELASVDDDRISNLTTQIESWIERARASQRLFAHLSNAEDREATDRIDAQLIVSEVVDQTRPLIRDVRVDFSGLSGDVILPPGRVADWTALFQNALFNAHDAMLDSANKNVKITSSVLGKRVAIFIQDTGVGVELNDSEELFEPFTRRLQISHERQRLQIGSSGLGLTIMRMIATTLGCYLRFTEPESGYATSLEIGWTES